MEMVRKVLTSPSEKEAQARFGALAILVYDSDGCKEEIKRGCCLSAPPKMIILAESSSR